MSTGPYLLDSVDIGRQIIYRKDPNWWGADQPLSVGRNNFETIRVEYFADSCRRVRRVQIGGIHFPSGDQFKGVGDRIRFPCAAQGLGKKDELPDGAMGTAQAFVFNLIHQSFQDRARPRGDWPDVQL